jgi:hypothetical protein
MLGPVFIGQGRQEPIFVPEALSGAAALSTRQYARIVQIHRGLDFRCGAVVPILCGLRDSPLVLSAFPTGRRKSIAG